jgi:hypothetical protein
MNELDAILRKARRNDYSDIKALIYAAIPQMSTPTCSDDASLLFGPEVARLFYDAVALRSVLKRFQQLSAYRAREKMATCTKLPSWSRRVSLDNARAWNDASHNRFVPHRDEDDTMVEPKKPNRDEDLPNPFPTPQPKPLRHNQSRSKSRNLITCRTKFRCRIRTKLKHRRSTPRHRLDCCSGESASLGGD